MLIIHCCKDCKKRFMNCHTYCEDYIREKEELTARKQQIRSSNEINDYRRYQQYLKRNKQVRKYGRYYK